MPKIKETVRAAAYFIGCRAKNEASWQESSLCQENKKKKKREERRVKGNKAQSQGRIYTTHFHANAYRGSFYLFFSFLFFSLFLFINLNRPKAEAEDACAMLSLPTSFPISPSNIST